MTAPGTRRTLRGWAKRHRAECWVSRPDTVDAVAHLLAACRESSISMVPRGHGCSYTQNALNDGGAVLDLGALDRIVDFDPDNGLITAEAGASLASIIDTGLGAGWVPGGAPGSPLVTVGGAIANNVHGKDCFKAGPFGRNVRALTLMAADGSVHRLTPDDDWFRFAVAGMGLVGVVLEATIQLTRLNGPLVESETVAFRELAELVDLMERHRSGADMLMGWVDAFDPKGRGSLEIGRSKPAEVGYVPPAVLGRPERFFGILPPEPVYPILRTVLRAPLMRAHNALKYRADGRAARRTTDFGSHAFPFASTVPDVAAVFPGGFVEAQILLPLEAAAKSHTDILAACRAAGATSWLCAAKLFSPDDYPLSFSGEGISLSICIPGRRARQADFPAFYDRMAGMAQDAGGKVNLTKDEFMSPARVRAMYPALGTFLAFKERVDPGGLFQSGFYRRLRD